MKPETSPSVKIMNLTSEKIKLHILQTSFPDPLFLSSVNPNSNYLDLI